MDKFTLCAVTLILLSYASASVKIIDLNVPDSIQIGTTDEIVMDCNFEATSDESAVIKWFYNGDVEQIYQWILDTKKPGAMGRLKDRLDLEYTVSNDSRTMYRALKIRNVTYDLSGNYTCKVSGDFNEDSETKQLVVYAPAKSDLEVILFKQDSLVICTVSGIYPVPKIDFYILEGNDTRIDISEDIQADPDGEGNYNVTARHHFDNTTLTGSTKFVCNLTIPGTDYSLSKSLEYYIDYENSIENEDDYHLWQNSALVPEDIYDILSVIHSANNTSEENFNSEGNCGISFNPSLHGYAATLLLILVFFTG